MNINTYNNKTNFEGWQETVNIINPISPYVSRYYEKATQLARKNVFDIVPSLENKVKVVKLNPSGRKQTYGWYIPPTKSKKHVLFLHGMAQNVSSEQRLYETIQEKGMGVFALEYRGYGTNKKTNFDENRMKKDVNSAYKYLTEDLKVSPEDIIVVGHSMGGALATMFASKHPEINSLVLISPITNLNGISKKFMHNKNCGYGIPDKGFRFPSIIGYLSGLRLNAMGKAEKLAMPTYIIQARNDSITPYVNARLFSSKINKNGNLKEFIGIPTGGHNIDSKKVSAVSDILERIE